MIPFTGSIVALVTPMLEDGSVDYPALKRLIDWHIQEGTACVCVVGTTGESPTVDVEEHCQIIKTAVEHAAGHPDHGGTGANSTREAIALSRFAKQVGADCALSVVPYYNKPSQEGIYQHFRPSQRPSICPPCFTTCRAGRSPTCCPTPPCAAQVCPACSASKEASGNIERAAYLIKHAPKRFHTYSGDDGTAIALMLPGGHGNVSVTANVAPRAMAELCRKALAGDAIGAREIHLRLLGLHKQLFCEPSPAPAKWAMRQLGLCGDAVRLPITPLTAAGQAAVAQALSEAGLR